MRADKRHEYVDNCGKSKEAMVKSQLLGTKYSISKFYIDRGGNLHTFSWPGLI